MPHSLILVSQDMLSPCPFLWSLSLYLFLLLYSTFWVPSEFHLLFTFLHLALATPLQGFIHQLHDSTLHFWPFRGALIWWVFWSQSIGCLISFHTSFFFLSCLSFTCKLIVLFPYIQLFWFHFLVALSLSCLSVSTSPGSILTFLIEKSEPHWFFSLDDKSTSFIFVQKAWSFPKQLIFTHFNFTLWKMLP